MQASQFTRASLDSFPPPVISRGMTNQKPQSYGTRWDANGLEVGRYRSLFNVRKEAHDRFIAWAASRVVPSSVLEVGCGCAFFYPALFADDFYVSVDISEKEIEWSKNHDASPDHVFMCGDIEELEMPQAFDLVFSHAVIDHVTDVDRFLRACARHVRPGGSLYVSAYREWNPSLSEHQYQWSDAETCSYTDVSHQRVRETLLASGLSDIKIEPVIVNTAVIKVEAAIIASRVGQ